MSFSTIQSFDKVNVSTKTIIGISNMIFDAYSIYIYLPVTEYEISKKKKKFDDETAKCKVPIPISSIMTVSNRTNTRGSSQKKKRNEKTFFLNAISIVVLITPEKTINVKLYGNGVFQATGCKTNRQFYNAISHIYKWILWIEKITGQRVHKIRDSEHPNVILNTVMKNHDFKLGFHVDREKLNSFLNENTEYISLYEFGVNNGVNVKIRSENPYFKHLKCFNIITNKISQVEFSEFSKLLEKRKPQQQHVKIKEKFHTFLIFASGSVIFTSSGPDMKNVYTDFMNILMKNRNAFEDTSISEK